jgi:hypothetical protein
MMIPAGRGVGTDILGPAWRTLTGAEQPVLVAGASPGYDHAARWAEALQEEAVLDAASSSSMSVAVHAS